MSNERVVLAMHGAGGWHDCGEDCCCCADSEDESGEFWVACDECVGGDLLVAVED